MTTRIRSKVYVGPGLPKFHYDAELVLDHAGTGRVWLARHPQLPGCMSHGVTADEALANLAEAAELYLAALDAAGVNRPPAPIHPRVMSMEPLRDRQETPPLTDEMPRTIS